MSAVEMKGLDAGKIAFLMANTRTRNAYGPKVLAFAESDEAAINPVDVWPIDFGGKNVSTLYQGFRKAVTDASLEDTILVKRHEDMIFLLHKERATLVAQDALDNAAE